MLVTKQPNERFFVIELDKCEMFVVAEIAMLFQLDTEEVMRGMFKFAEHMAVGKILNKIAEVAEWENDKNESNQENSQ